MKNEVARPIAFYGFPYLPTISKLYVCCKLNEYTKMLAFTLNNLIQ